MHPIERVRFCCPTVFRLNISFVLLREIFVKFRRRSNIVCSIFYPLGRGLPGLTMRRNRTRVRIKWRFRRTAGNWGWFRNCDIVRTHSHNALRRNSYFLSFSLLYRHGLFAKRRKTWRRGARRRRRTTPDSRNKYSISFHSAVTCADQRKLHSFPPGESANEILYSRRHPPEPGTRCACELPARVSPTHPPTRAAFVIRVG